MKDAWKGIAIAGIWIGTGIASMHSGAAIMVVAMFAMMATLMVAS